MSIDYEPQTVTVKGKVSALNRITNINVPASALDISGARGDVKQTIDVSSYLPAGVSMVGEGKINVTAVIDSIVSKNITYFSSRIEVLNLPEDSAITFRDKYISLVLTGKENIINNTTSSSIVLSLDASLLKYGSNKVELVADVPAGVEVGDIFADVVLSHVNINTGGSDEEITDDAGGEDSSENESGSDTAVSDNTSKTGIPGEDSGTGDTDGGSEDEEPDTGDEDTSGGTDENEGENGSEEA